MFTNANSVYTEPCVAGIGRHREDKVTAVELYDGQTNSQENINISNDPANKALIEKLTAQSLVGWRGAEPK